MKPDQKLMNMVLSPSLGDVRRQGSHFVSGGGQKVAVVSRYTRACPLVPPTLSSQRRLLFRLSPKRQRERETYPSLPVLLFSSPYANCGSPTSSPRFPHLGELDHLPFCARRTLWPPSSRQKRRSLSTLLILATLPPTRPLPLSSSPPGSLPPPTATIPPVPPSRDIITPFYSRFIGLYQLHCRRTVCIVAACLGCHQRDR